MGRVLGSASASAAPLGLYVHIPFCLERCRFCYYRSYAGRARAEMERYVEVLAREAPADAVTPAFADRRLAFAYVGGGTPSLLAAEQIRALMRHLRAAFAWDEAREVSFECAPRTVTGRKVEALAECGVTRVSLGVQQLNDDVLRANGRSVPRSRHSPQQGWSRHGNPSPPVPSRRHGRSAPRLEVASGPLQGGAPPSCLSSRSFDLAFGSGRPAEIERLAIRFPGGAVMTLTGVAAGGIITVEE